jgi:hypothetical protein
MVHTVCSCTSTGWLEAVRASGYFRAGFTPITHHLPASLMTLNPPEGPLLSGPLYYLIDHFSNPP